MNRLPLIAFFCASVAMAATGTVPSPTPPPLPTSGGFAPPPPSVPSKPSPLPTPAEAPLPPPTVTPAPTITITAKPDEAPEAAIPQAFPRSRYETSWKKNPFLLKTAPVIQTKESWAADFALTSIAKLSGIYRVSIKNKKTGESKRLSEASNADAEFKIVKVNLLPDRKSSSVEIEKGGEKATLTYDVALTTPQPRGAVPGQPGGARPGMPVIPGQPSGFVPPTIPGRTTSSSGQPGTPAGNSQRTSLAGGSASIYAGNAGGYVGGGGVGAGASASPNATVTRGAGGVASSRLGGLVPGAVGTSQNTLTPTGVASGGVTSIPSQQASSSDPLGNTSSLGTTTPSDTTNNTATTPVTRRRSLIPAPVVSQ